MPFHGLEDFESKFLTPHLSTGKALVIEGEVDIRVDNDRKQAGQGDIVEIPRGSETELSVAKSTRYAVVRSMPALETEIEGAE